MKRSMRVLASSLLIALSPLAFADSDGDSIDHHVSALDNTASNRGQAQVAGKIASNFTNLAGSKQNALALVIALRNGTNATLTYKTAATTPGGTPTTTTATYDPPTGKMGWGSVKISLALAQDSLSRAGINHPTEAQLQAALNGGPVSVKNADGTTTTTTLKGVLQMRADGMGWGAIAKANGTKVGTVLSELKQSQHKVAELPRTDGKKDGSDAGEHSKKVVKTADGSTASKSAEKSAKGAATANVSTAAKSAASSKGVTTATGSATAQSAKGIVTAEGASATGHSKGTNLGRGVITGTGGDATRVASTVGGKPASASAGVITGTGGATSGVTTATGGENGKGNAGGNGKGKGGG